jgi:hypothetical protein
MIQKKLLGVILGAVLLPIACSKPTIAPVETIPERSKSVQESAQETGTPDILSTYCRVDVITPVVVKTVSAMMREDVVTYVSELSSQGNIEKLMLVARAIGNEEQYQDVLQNLGPKIKEFINRRDAVAQKINESSLENLKNDIVRGVFAENQLPVAFYFLSLKTAQQNQFDESVEYFKCAAKNYYDPLSMFKLAQLYKYGSDEFQKKRPELVIKKRIEKNDRLAFFWIIAGINVDTVRMFGLLDASTSLGWNTIAMMDTYQNTEQNFDRDEVYKEVNAFVALKYPGLTRKP